MNVKKSELKLLIARIPHFSFSPTSTLCLYFTADDDRVGALGREPRRVPRPRGGGRRHRAAVVLQRGERRQLLRSARIRRRRRPVAEVRGYWKAVKVTERKTGARLS